MKILITGASSGLGREMARQLAPKAEKLILAARSRERLEALQKELSGVCPSVEIFCAELDKTENCLALHEAYPDVDFLINNAGFGEFGEFTGYDLDVDLRMIDTNVKALHILMKLYLSDMVKRDSGRILNVSSVAAFMPGPLFSTYYATKAYVLRLSESVRKELKKRTSHVKISVLCPGPVKTNFFNTATLDVGSFGADCAKTVRYTLKHLDRYYIIPGLPVRLGKNFLLPYSQLYIWSYYRGIFWLFGINFRSNRLYIRIDFPAAHCRFYRTIF